MVEEKLRDLFKRYKKILFAGLGNEFRKDDRVGIYISTKIKNTKKVQSLLVGQSIENHIGKINKMDPDLLVLIDCVDMNKVSGQAALLTLKEIKDFTTNTHSISLNKFAEFFTMPVFVLGIQPLNTSFGEQLSETVCQTADRIIEIINYSEESR